MARLGALLAALLLAVAGAFAPAPVRTTTVVPRSTLMDEADILINQAVDASIARMETRVKDLTADIEAAEKSATENLIAERLDKIEAMIRDISMKL
mmetsp:Transcript_7577/g.23085  ORF Transcript_7577/g.23085 Transcript_7577/m.23085 type:complete len:96 (+) Transcript_7577:37-324(+)